MNEMNGQKSDMLKVFLSALEGADRVIVETPNALGELDAHYLHAPTILEAWNTRTPDEAALSQARAEAREAALREAADQCVQYAEGLIDDNGSYWMKTCLPDSILDLIQSPAPAPDMSVREGIDATIAYYRKCETEATNESQRTIAKFQAEAVESIKALTGDTPNAD